MPATNYPTGIEPLDITDWENAHRNFKHVFKQDASFALHVFSDESKLTDYNATTKNIEWLIKNAIDNNATIRAMGNNWSFTPVAMCDGGMIETKGLNLRFQLGNSSLSPVYLQSGKTKDDLVFVQCGITIYELNKLIETKFEPKRSIKASGGSNGQTIAGATATGTHGGALFTGAVHDAIVGLHIVTGPGRHVYIERASYPVVSDEFINAINAEIIRSDDMFNAAVVSFGSFGVIHGIMLETDPIYLLAEYRFDNVAYTDALTEAVSTQNFDALRAIIPTLPVDTTDRKLYHLEMAINPSKFAKNDAANGIYIRTFYKIPCPAAYAATYDNIADGLTYSDDVPGIIAKVLDTLGPAADAKIIGPLVNSLFQSTLRAAQPSPKTIGETFHFTRFRGQIASAAIAVDCKDVFRVVELVLEINKTSPFAGGIALRFVKGTKATLGFTKFDKTCVLELDGIDGKITRSFFEKVWQTLEKKDISFTLHWGKFNYILNKDRVLKMYGKDKVDDWKKCRETLMDAASRKVFTNQFMVDCGLD